ncbi:hypothetical protein BJV78DRAFT_936192 [Lactifluus subvellereus]|nr:hypothetical protein BJV78DRAFT_936192 [Lactifluus subvellereus]
MRSAEYVLVTSLKRPCAIPAYRLCTDIHRDCTLRRVSHSFHTATRGCAATGDLTPSHLPSGAVQVATDSATTVSRPTNVHCHEMTHFARDCAWRIAHGTWNMRHHYKHRITTSLVTVMWRGVDRHRVLGSVPMPRHVAAPSPPHLRLSPPVRPIRLVPSYFPCGASQSPHRPARP